ncbi:MAG: molecular chaperone HscB [Candidatus Binataceae bacterium]|nr:molecular chaperone HscB [Candidatus Binataceae bacterium]
MIKCSSCETVQEPRLLCAKCGAPTGAALDLFAALGLPRKLSIDSARLEQLYHDLGRRIHPDRFANGATNLRDASLRGTALLTRAYRTLRDPVSRGLCWLELNGHKLAENNKSVPADLAEMVFEVQEQLADLREARGGGGTEADRLRAGIEDRRVALHCAIEAAQQELAQNFARWDALSDAPGVQSNARPDTHGGPSDAPPDMQGVQSDAAGERDALVAELKSILSKIAYLRTLIRDIDRELDSAQAA